MPCRTAPAWPDEPPPTTLTTRLQRLLDDELMQLAATEVLARGLAVDGDLAVTRKEPDAGDGRFAAACPVEVTLCGCCAHSLSQLNVCPGSVAVRHATQTIQLGA